MMINCPKCNLLQPKDQYCAQCGVNMETWKPPAQPLWKKLLGNWMVQLALLFVAILGVVTWDNFSNRDPSQSGSSPPPVANRIERSESFAPPAQQDEPAAVQTESLTADVQSSNRPKTQTPEENPAQPSPLPLDKKVSLKLMTLTPAAVESLGQLTRRLDDGIYLMKRGDGFFAQNRKNIKGYGSAVRKTYEFDQPVELFFGETDQESGLALGFYTQVSVASGSTSEAINVEIRFWHQLKLSDEPSPPIVVEATLQRQEGVVIVDPSVHDTTLSPEESTLYETSRRLAVLTDDLFLENLTDVAVLIEFK